MQQMKSVTASFGRHIRSKALQGPVTVVEMALNLHCSSVLWAELGKDAIS